MSDNRLFLVCLDCLSGEGDISKPDHAWCVLARYKLGNEPSWSLHRAASEEFMDTHQFCGPGEYPFNNSQFAVFSESEIKGHDMYTTAAVIDTVRSYCTRIIKLLQHKGV